VYLALREAFLSLTINSSQIKLGVIEKYLQEILAEYERNDRKDKNAILEGATLPFFIQRNDANRHSINGRDRVDAELFHPVGDVEQRLIDLILRSSQLVEKEPSTNG
jgi:hypothetical protein